MLLILTVAQNPKVALGANASGQVLTAIAVFHSLWCTYYVGSGEGGKDVLAAARNKTGGASLCEGVQMLMRYGKVSMCHCTEYDQHGFKYRLCGCCPSKQFFADHLCRSLYGGIFHPKGRLKSDACWEG